MKRWIVLAAGLMLAFAAVASDSVRFGNRVITVGDSEGKVLQIAGKPDRKIQLETKYGGADGYRLEYDVGSKVVQIVIHAGAVSEIEEVY